MSPPTARRTAIRYAASFARGQPLVCFFLLAFGSSWIEVAVLGIALHLPAALVIGLTTLGPTLASLSTTALVEGRTGLRRLWERMALRRVESRWYFFGLAAIPLVYLLGTLVLPGNASRGTWPSPVPWVVSYFVILTAGGIVGGPLFEEPGWRGFALPRLQAKFGPLLGTLVLGGLWGAWHLPQFFVPEWASQNAGLHPVSIAVFLLTVVSIAVIMTWVFNNTKGSLLLAMLVHSSVNTSQVVVVNRLFPNAVNTEVNALLGFGMLALILIVITRSHLGYQCDIESELHGVVAGRGHGAASMSL